LVCEIQEMDEMQSLRAGLAVMASRRREALPGALIATWARRAACAIGRKEEQTREREQRSFSRSRVVVMASREGPKMCSRDWW